MGSQLKVLFVSSANKISGGSPIVLKQGESLKKIGVDVDNYFIADRGVAGYIKGIHLLRKRLRESRYDIVHAHYSLSGIVAILAGCHPLVISLMGSDVHKSGFFLQIIKLLSRIKCESVIVKSDGMKEQSLITAAEVIPNGVDLESFHPVPQNEARQRVGFNGKKHVVFIGDPQRHEKNFQLAEAAFALLNDESVELNVISGQPHELMVDYMNAADVLLLTSFWEGSPNVVKEAMACNLPIVATDVGDVRWMLGDTPGCFLTSFSPEDMALKIKLALDFKKKTSGRERIIKLGLDSASIAKKIFTIYENVIGK